MRTEGANGKSVAVPPQCHRAALPVVIYVCVAEGFLSCSYVTRFLFPQVLKVFLEKKKKKGCLQDQIRVETKTGGGKTSYET